MLVILADFPPARVGVIEWAAHSIKPSTSRSKPFHSTLRGPHEDPYGYGVRQRSAASGG